MSDEYYRQRAARRTRLIWLSIGLVAAVMCLYLAITRIFWDECTQSFQRSPQAITQSYLQAIQQGNQEQPRRCWVDSAFFDLEAGCSEICVERILGTEYLINNISVGEVELTDDGRARQVVEVAVSCPAGGQSYTGALTLDSIRQNVPWQHWKIIHSTVGGPLSSPWCQ
jgi:hypothetical protein